MNGLAFDTSNFRNHGIPIGVMPAAGAFAPAFQFSNADSEVLIKPSASLQNLIAVRAVVTLFLETPSGLVRRYNLIEEHLSFALFVNPPQGAEEGE